MDDEEPQGPWLLVSDIDDTLTGDRDALEKLWQSASKHPDRLKIALNSSRPSASVDRTIAECFPADFAPDAVITALGTEIRAGGNWVDDWSRRFSGWPRDEIAGMMIKMGFQPHADEFQTPAKASFAVPGRAAAADVLDRLADAGFRFDAVFSGESDLDLLAPGAGKDRAARFLADYLGILPTRVVAAGDSGNDLAMFRAFPHAIAVGNARRELTEAMPVDTTYHAKGAYAAGVHEGLIALGILPASE
jgi:hypothetical protein